jgi:hypothetical protein
MPVIDLIGTEGDFYVRKNVVRGSCGIHIEALDLSQRQELHATRRLDFSSSINSFRRVQK